MKKKQTKNIYDRYREILKMPHLTNKEIDKARMHIRLIAIAICEQVWKKDFY